MRNNFLNLLINILLLNIFIFLFLYSINVKENILYAFNIWFNTLIPSIFPFIIISSLLINYGFIDILSYIFGPLVEHIFYLPKEAAYAIIISFFTGFPTGSKYVRDLLENNIIDEEEANHLIMFTSYSNPLFVISGIGEAMLGNKEIGIIIFTMHVISGLLVGLIFRKKRRRKVSKNISNNKESFITVLINSINNAFKILLNMLGIIIFFLIVISMFDNIFSNNLFTAIIKGLLEMTTGINNLVKMNINNRFKASLIGFFLSFSGICVHFQTKSIIDGTKIQYKKYLIARILHALLCFILIYLFYH